MCLFSNKSSSVSLIIRSILIYIFLEFDNHIYMYPIQERENNLEIELHEYKLKFD